MSAVRWPRVQALFEQALDRERHERETFLREACADDTDLLDDVRSLLDADEHADGLLDAVLVEEEEGDHREKHGAVPSRIGPYRVLGPIGAGGMGRVYKALDTRLDRHVALKFLHPAVSAIEGVRERFVLEAKAASGLDHLNICTVHDVGETEAGQTYICMAFYDGESLRERLSNGPLGPAAGIDVAVQIGAGLGAAHARGICHRDIKPANVMITPEGRAMLLDFGVAKVPGMDLTATGTQVGTAAYMAPEQFCAGRIDQRTDIWALGVILFEMIAGRRPFEGEHDAAVMNAILNAPVPALAELVPGCPERLGRTVARALCRSPSGRYATAESMVAELREARGALAGDHEEPSPAGGDRPGAVVAEAPERRQVTVLYCSLSGSAELLRRVDPEELRELVHAYRASVTPLIERFDGSVARLADVAVMACFGFPRAREDDAERAVHAALGIVDAVTGLNETLGRTGSDELAVRVAIDTGLVVTGDATDEGPGRYEVVGETPDLAMRLHETAGTNDVLVSPRTHQLVGGLFVCDDAGTRRLEGLAG